MSNNQTTIAQEFQRIENARDILAQKAVEWGLKGADDQEITYSQDGTDTSAIDDIAHGFDSVPTRNEDSVEVFGPNVS